MTTTRRQQRPAHGTRSRYAYWQCRCVDCRNASRRYEKRRQYGLGQSQFVNPVGTRRRIQGLVAMGYCYATLAERLGASRTWIPQLASANGSRGVLRKTDVDVDVLCRELAALPPPTGRSATYARTVAKRYGWPPLAAWDDIDDPDEQPNLDGDGVEVVDDVLVQRAIDGDANSLARLNRAERVEAARRLLARPGITVGSLPRLLNVSGKTAHRLAGSPSRQERRRDRPQLAR